MSTNSHDTFDMNQSFLRQQDGRLSPAEKRKLETWLTDPEHRKAWDRMQSVWQAARDLPIPQGTPQDAQWKTLLNRMSAAEAHARQTRPQVRVSDRLLSSIAPRLPRLAIATGLAALLVVLAFRTDMFRPGMHIVTVPFGQQMQVSLPDGSSVHLSAGSTFEYPRSFDSHIRQVRLKGEGFFAVRPNHRVPFLVETTQARTRVLGTEFNVRTWDSATEVYVKSGRVAVHSNAVQASEVEVLPGQLAVCEDGPISVQPTEPGALLSWRQGRLVFANKRLDAALAEIERTYNVPLAADPALLELSISASFSKESLQTVLETLAASLNARLERAEDGFRLASK